MRRLVALLFFLAIVDEGDPTTVYSQHMFAPFTWVNPVLFAPLPIKIRVFDVILAVILIVASSRRSSKLPVVAPMRNALFLGVATTVVWFAYGIATGGDARAASWQTYLILSTALMAFVVSACFQTTEQYALLAKALVAAALYRAAMCWYFHYVYIVTGLVSVDPAPQYVTAHDDTVVWVVAILALIVYAATQQKRGVTLRVLAGVVFLIFAIQYNQRRLAWVSLSAALATTFFLIPQGLRRRVVRAGAFLAPVIVVYTVVGWGRPESVFRPLRSFSTVSGDEDNSTKARNCENLGLIATVSASNPVTGTGWGHPYISLTDKYSIASFMELWPYVPHNSILGLLAYTGVLGFAGFWLALPTAVFLTARVARGSRSPPARSYGIVSCSAVIVCANQLYGDMGIFSIRTMYMLATIYGVALRLPQVAGVWEAAKGKVARPAAPARAR